MGGLPQPYVSSEGHKLFCLAVETLGLSESEKNNLSYEQVGD